MDIANDKAQKSFEGYLNDSIQQKRYVKIQYFTDIREFITLMAVTVEIIENEKASSLLLNTGDEINIDKIVKIDDIYAPKYAHIDDFTCDC